MKHNKRFNYLITTILVASMLFAQTVGASAWSTTDQFSFANNSTNFNTGNYYMNDTDFQKLCSYIRGYYSEASSNAVINKITSQRSASWNGSCYGMSMTTLLHYNGKIDFISNFDSGKANMSKVLSPKKNKKVMSAINYYYMSQVIPFIRSNSSAYQKSSSDWSKGLSNLVEKAQNGEQMIFSYMTTKLGHAIVLTGGTVTGNSKNGYKIPAYDNRYPKKTIYVTVSGDFKSCTVNGSEKTTYVEYSSDFSSFDQIDIDGADNDASTMSLSGGVNLTGTYIAVALNSSDVTVTNEEGKTLNFVNGIIADNSTMDVSDSHIIVNSTSDGSQAPEILVNVDDSDSFSFKSNGEKILASVMGDDYFGCIEALNSNGVTFDSDGITIKGKNASYKAYKSVGDDGSDMYNLEGITNSDAKISYSDDGFNITGDSALAAINKYTGANLDSYTGNASETNLTDEQIDELKTSLRKWTLDLSVKSITVGKKCMTVKASAEPPCLTDAGYRIAYKIHGTSKWSTTTTSTISKKIAGLKSGKKYDVRLRPYARVNGEVQESFLWTETKTSKAVK